MPRPTPTERTKPWGFLRVMRASARAAIELKSWAALRVFVLIAEYANQDGECWVAQGTIAARLQVSRQSVNRQVTILRKTGLIEVAEAEAADGQTGRSLRYRLNLADLDDRTGQEKVAERRQAAKVERAIARERQKGNDPVEFHDRIGFGRYQETLKNQAFGPETERIARKFMEEDERKSGIAYRRIGIDARGREFYVARPLESGQAS